MYTIRDLCKTSKLSRSTILYYDSLGLLKPDERTESNYRLYSEGSLNSLRKICLYRDAGVSLEDIKVLLNTPECDSRSISILEKTLLQLNELDKTGDFNREVFSKMALSGFTGVKIPEEYGGQGGDSLAYVLMIEEFARVSAVLSVYANTSNSLGAGSLLICGNEEQKQKYLPALASGEKILVFGLTEPDAGSDAGGIRTTAKKD